jgi:hypothetical protein
MCCSVIIALVGISHQTEATMRILSEQRITLPQAAPLMGTEDQPVHLSTVLRAVTIGIKLAKSDERKRLEAIRAGGRWITSVEAVERFLSAMTAAALHEAAPTETPETMTARRHRELAQVDRDLDAFGITENPTPPRRGRKSKSATE